MSGKIKLIVRKSIPKINPKTGKQFRPELKYYPGWIWDITGEDGKCARIMPSWDNIEKAIEETIIHELKVDTVIGRNDRQRYTKFLVNMINKCKALQTKVIHFSKIEKIYTECKK